MGVIDSKQLPDFDLESLEMQVKNKPSLDYLNHRFRYSQL